MTKKMSTVILSLLAGIACAAPSPAPASGADGPWIGTITAEGDVTTVVNESGSVWGGAATLVEEASIGVDVGAPEYMLAGPASVTADDERIYIAERRPAMVRVYDLDGNHIRDIGSEGQGPGEFAYPASIVLTGEGNLLVRDDNNHRIVVYSPEGQLLESWMPWAGGFSTSDETVIGPDGAVYAPAPVARNPNPRGRRSIGGFIQRGPDGPIGDPLLPPTFDFEPLFVESGTAQAQVPFTPQVETSLTPFDAWLAGVSDAYRFEIRYFDGRLTVVERNASPVLLSNEERDWNAKRLLASFRQERPDFRWSGPPVPEHKPYYARLHADLSHRIWVHLHAPSTPVEGCNPDPQPGDSYSPCWQQQYEYDVFGQDGRYLGPLEMPPELRGAPLHKAHIRDDVLITVVQDEAGTIMVKRYRLVLPGGE
jgi:hypothetical protein